MPGCDVGGTKLRQLRKRVHQVNHCLGIGWSTRRVRPLRDVVTGKDQGTLGVTEAQVIGCVPWGSKHTDLQAAQHQGFAAAELLIKGQWQVG